MTATVAGADEPARGTRVRPFDPRLLRMVPAARSPVAVLAGVGIVAGVVAIGQALAVAALVVAVVRAQPLATPLGWTAGLFALRGAVDGLGTWAAGWAGVRVATALRARAVAATLRLSAEDRPGPARLQPLLEAAPTAVEPWVSRYLPALVSAAVVPLAAIATMLWLHPGIALIPILTVPLLPLFAALIGQYTAEETDRRWRALQLLSGHFLDVMQGLPVLVDYGRARGLEAAIRDVAQRLRRTTVATLRTAFMSAAALELLASISVAIVAVFVGLALAEGRMDLAVGLPLILVAPEAYWPIRRVGTEFHAAADGAQAIDDLLGLVAAAPEPRTGDGRVGLVLDEVVVGHGTPLASGITLRVPRPGPAGTASGLVAVTGPSGCGKTTLLEVVASLRRPLAGRVVTRGQVHLVDQRRLLVPGTVRDNLCIAAPDASDDDLWSALRATGLHGVVAALGDGLDARLGHAGHGLSAGQRTRLVLARAWLSGASTIVVDEPTAHLDDDARSTVAEALAALARDRVVVAATHDPALEARAAHHVELATHAFASGDAAGVVRDPKSGDTRAAVRADRGAGTQALVRGAEPPRAHSSSEDDASRRGGRDRDDVDIVVGTTWSRRQLRAGLVGGLARASGVALTATSGWLIVAASFEPQLLVLLVAIVSVRAFGIARPVLRWFERVRSHDLAMGELADRRAALWRRLVPLAPARLGARDHGRLLTSVVDDLDDVVGAQVRVVVPVVAMGAALLVALLVAAVTVPATVVAILGLGIALAVVGLVVFAAERRNQDAVVAARAEVASVTTLVARDALALAGAEAGPWTARRLDAAHADLAARLASQFRGRAIASALVPAAVAAATAGAALAAAQAVAAGLPTPVAALAVLLPLGLGEALGSDVVSGAGEWARARAAAANLAVLLGSDAAVHDPEVPISVPADPLHRALVDVTARWSPGRPDVVVGDLAWPPGAHVGLVGPNGSGKSTAIAVLARHLDPHRGAHLVRSGRGDAGAAVDATACTIADVRARLARVGDAPHVFSSTVRENLRLARPDASDAHVVAALHAAGLGSWVSSLPDGLDTHLGAGRRGMSGGERSRLGIARALLSGRQAVVMDEPVAHLDHPTAVAVMADVAASCRDRALLVAMHRPEGMQAMDRVVAMGTAPVEAGPPADRPTLVGR